MANLLSTSVTGTVNSTGNMTAAGFTGNANVGGTGAATWHPSGIYAGSTQWLYGAMYKNGSGIYDAGEITTSSHGTSANWKSAYDWGNHASAGYITSSGSISGTAARATRANGNFYIDDNYGNTVVGVYASTRYQGVFAMGDSYKLPADGSSTGSLYGMAWSHPNAGGVAGNLNTHGLLVMENGTFLAAVSGSIRARDDMRAPALYDSGSRVAISRGEGRNYVDYSRYVYNNGAYSGSGWIEPSDLGVRYANSAGSTTFLSNVGNYSWSSSTLPTSYSQGLQLSFVGPNSGEGSWQNYGTVLTARTYSGGGGSLQMYVPYGPSNGGDSLQVRFGNYNVSSGNSWTGWKTLIDSGIIGSQSVNYASSAGSASTATTATNLSGFDKTNPSFGAVYANNWFRAYGDTGLYLQDYGGHFRRNTSSSHGTFEIFGYAKGGYNGLLIKDDAGYFNNYMHEGGNGGLYCENQGGRWPWYWHRGNTCLGLGNSTTSSSYRVYVNGSLYAEGDIVAYSDARKKSEIVTIDNALDKVQQLRGVYYVRTDEAEKGRQTGVIAQEINEVLPEVVTYAADIDEYGVKYGNIVGVLIEAIKEQQAQIEDLKLEIKKLRGE